MTYTHAPTAQSKKARKCKISIASYTLREIATKAHQKHDYNIDKAIMRVINIGSVSARHCADGECIWEFDDGSIIKMSDIKMLYSKKQGKK